MHIMRQDGYTVRCSADLEFLRASNLVQDYVRVGMADSVQELSIFPDQWRPRYSSPIDIYVQDRTP